MKIFSFLGINCLVFAALLVGVFIAGWFAGREKGRQQGRAEAIRRKEKGDV